MIGPEIASEYKIVVQKREPTVGGTRWSMIIRRMTPEDKFQFGAVYFGDPEVTGATVTIARVHERGVNGGRALAFLVFLKALEKDPEI